MVKLITTVLLIALLFCSTSIVFATRSTPVSLPQNKESDERVGADGMESCQGLNDEECLIRRTLVAHTDYIYTNGHNRP